MLFSQLLRDVSPFSPLPKELTTLAAKEEAIRYDSSVPRAHLVETETNGKSAVGEADIPIHNEGPDSKQEVGRHQQALCKDQVMRETRELHLLQEMLPYLLQTNRLQEAEGAIYSLIERNPRNADGFVLLADVYSHGGNLAASCECLWGAIYNSPGNRMLLRLLRSAEEQFLLRECQLPHSFLVKSLEAPACSDDARPLCRDLLDSFFTEEDAHVMVMRQGNLVAAVTTRKFEPGDVIFRQRPFVLTPLMLESGQIYTSCFHCLQEREDPARGYSCPVKPYTCPFVFCSWDCLMRNSRIHALECQAIPLLLAAAKEAKLSYTTVLHIFRTILKTGLERQSRPSEENSEDTNRSPTDVIEQLLRLNSYRAAVEIGQPELYRQLTILARRFHREFPAYILLFLCERDLIELMLVLWQYSPFITSPSVPAAVDGRNPDGAIGQMLAPAVAFLQHSCVPTCGLCLQEDGMVAVRALTFIPAGGALCISLEEDLYRSQRDRKGVTAPPRVFGCGCVRCIDSTEGGRLLRGIRCFSCIRGFLCPHKSKSVASRLTAYSAALSTYLEPLGIKKRAGNRITLDLETDKEPFLHNPQGLISALGGDDKSPPEGRPPSQKENALLDEEWLCAYCCSAGAAVSRKCSLLEQAVERQQFEAEKALVSGDHLRARKEYISLVHQYSTQLHPQHAVLFNAHIILAGLLSSQPERDAPQALIFLRRAILAAETVLPPSSRLKMDLYIKLAELTYQAMRLDQHCRRGPSLPPEHIMSPMHAALWNAVVCFGNDSSLVIVLQQRLRRYAALLGVCTPPLLVRPVLRTVDVFVGLYREVTGSRISDQAITDHFMSDPMFLAVALIRRGLCFPLTLQVFMAMKDVPHLPTGLTLLGLACLHKQVGIVGELLKMGFDMFQRTALGVTALLAMCAGTKPPCEPHDALGRKGICAAEVASGVDDSSRREVAILRLLLQRCDDLDLQKPTRPIPPVLTEQHSFRSSSLQKTANAQQPAARGGDGREIWSNRSRLLNAPTHKLLGRSYALHFAASKGKATLCRQLLAAGCLVGSRNSEAATALHIACIAGDLETVKILLDYGAQLDATTLRGETPLILAAYNLHEDICALLLGRGADSSLTSRAERFSVLHALAAGVNRQVSMCFRGLSWERDGVSAALVGLGEDSLRLGLYSKTNSYIAAETMVDVRIPSALPEDAELFLFPNTMLQRTKKAQDVLLVLMKHCNKGLYSQQSRKGLSPAELLLRMWDAFLAKRERMLKINDLQLECQSTEERKRTLGGWEYVLHRILVLRDMLMPELVPSETTQRSEYLDTPRREDLERRSKERIMADAPWLSPELLQHSAPSAKPPPQRKLPAPWDPKASLAETQGGQPTVAVVGTGSQFLPKSAHTGHLPQTSPQTKEPQTTTPKAVAHAGVSQPGNSDGPPETAKPPSDLESPQRKGPPQQYSKPVSAPKAQVPGKHSTPTIAATNSSDEGRAPTGKLFPPDGGLPPSSEDRPPSTKEPPPSTKEPPPATKGPPPSSKGPPPSSKGPPPSSKGPPPSSKGHPPSTTGPSPLNKGRPMSMGPPAK